MTKFNVNASLFARVANAQSTEETRFYLQGVSIEPAPHGLPGVTLTATDGTALVTAYDAQGSVDAPVIVKAPAHVLKACKPWRNGTEPHLIGNDGTIAVIDDKGDEQLARGTTVDGSFPDWKRVIPQDIGAGTGAVFSPVVMATLAKALIKGKQTGIDASGLIVRGIDALSAHLVWGDDSRMIGVAMPVRTPNVDERATLPQWASRTLPGKLLNEAA
jgi:hypothetical protein